MRIMYFAGGGDIGGAKTHILSLGCQLAKENDFCLVSFRPGEFADAAKELGLYTIVAEKAWNIPAALKLALKAVDEFKPDVIHCHGAKANMMGALVKKLRGTAILTTVHSDPRKDYMGQPFKQALFGSINLWALKRMDFHMAVAGRMENYLIEHGFDPQRIFKVYNGLDFSSANNKDILTREDDDVVVAIAARLTPVKDISTLIKAFAVAYGKNPKLKLKIAGIGEEEAALRRLADKLQISHRVDFVGWITDMSRFFAGVDINVLCSLSETFPYSLLEGAKEHCAAIASSVGGIPELIKDGETGYLFPPGDVDTFAQLIYELSVDKDLRIRMADALYEKAMNEFSLQKMSHTQQEAYRRVIRYSARKNQRQGAVICGAYGRGNAGDEAIMQAITAQMLQIDPDMPLVVMSRNRRDTRLKNRTDAIYIFNIPQLFMRLRKARLFINGGGSLIQDVTSSRSLYFYLFTLWAAKICGCRVLMYGCGVGPITRSHNRKIAAYVLNHNVERITLRDSNSINVLAQMGVDGPVIQLSADPTVTLAKASSKSVAHFLNRDNIPEEGEKIAFCLRNWPDFIAPKAIAAAADYAYFHYGLQPVFLPIELPKDISAAQSVTSLMKAPYYACKERYTVDELIGVLGSMKLVVGMRLHSLIFATLGCTPVIGLSYDVKVSSFIKDIGSPFCVPIKELTSDILISYIDKIAESGWARADEANLRLREGEEINIAAARILLEDA